MRLFLLLLAFCFSGCGPTPPVSHVASHPTPIAPTDQKECLSVDSLTVGGLPATWHIRCHNSCGYATVGRIYVRLAFYDAASYRHGFRNFVVEPMLPGERVRLDDSVPRQGITSAKVHAMTSDAAESLKWGLDLW